MLRPAISWRTLAVLDLIRVPPPAASTITVRSLDMGTNLTRVRLGSAIVRRVHPAPSGCRVGTGGCNAPLSPLVRPCTGALAGITERYSRQVRVLPRQLGPNLEHRSPVGLP